MKRVFLVGCPRSGTTLLQSRLATHPCVESFPESFFYNYFVPSKKILANLGIASRWCKPKFLEFLENIDRKDLAPIFMPWTISMSQYSDIFIDTLDGLTSDKQKSVWIEKTPSHLRYIHYIEKFVRAPVFVHIIRSGEDVIASLYEVTHNHPDIWGGVRTIDQCIDQWIDCIRRSSMHLEKSNHLFIKYEKFIEDPRLSLSNLCQALGLNFSSDMLDPTKVHQAKYALSNETWKASISQTIKQVNSDKFYRTFEERERTYILKKISDSNAHNLIEQMFESEV